jgi:NitT/TauT family transport system permease protein
MTHASGTVTAAGATALESILGLLIAAAFSFATMYLCCFYPSILKAIVPVFVTSQTIPLIALAPFFIILFGLGMAAKIMMAALLCFFPIFINIAGAYARTPSEFLELAFLYDAPVSFRIRHIYLPLATPAIFSGLKVSATLAVVGALVAEFNGANYGLGKDIFIAAKRLDAELLVLSIALSSLLGLAMYHAVATCERFVGRWYLEHDMKEMGGP